MKDSRYQREVDKEGSNLKYIYFTDDFRRVVGSEEDSIELSSFRLGEYSSDVPRGKKLPDGTHDGIKYINYEYMMTSITLPTGQNVSDSVSPVPSDKPYNMDGIYDPKTQLLNMYVIPKTSSGDLDEGMYDDSKYRILYVLYRNVLTDIERLAFVIYNEDIEINSPTLVLDPLKLSRYNNLITLKIPFKCEVITYMDRDTAHLEGPGVNYMNYYSIPESLYNKIYVDKSSYKRYYYNSISSNNPYQGGVTINKFGLKSY